jgi:hypothetical protein
MDLYKDFFRWSEIDGAAYYQVAIIKKESRIGEGRIYTGGVPIQVRTNSLCLGTLPESEVRLVDDLTPGTSAVWHVHAFDAEGHRIGTSGQAERTILVGKGIHNR